MAKCRVTSLRTITMVRIELGGALMAYRIKNLIERKSRLKSSKVYFIVDSQIVFSLLQKDSYGFATYAAVRIDDIQENTNPGDWFCTEGDNNIADWLTRGRRPSELGQSSIWQGGPQFIREPVDEWLVYQVSSILEVPEQVQHVMQSNIVKIDSLVKRIDIDKFSLYIKLIRVTARILLMYSRNCQITFRNGANQLDKEHLGKAELFGVKDAQK